MILFWSGAIFDNVRGMVVIGPGGSDHDFLYAINHAPILMIKRGCFWGTLDEFIEQVANKPPVHSKDYYQQAVIPMLKNLIEFWPHIE